MICVDNEESTAKGDNKTIKNVSVNLTEGDGDKINKLTHEKHLNWVQIRRAIMKK